MGFLSDLGKAFMGKPLGWVKPNKAALAQGARHSPQGNGITDERGYKIIPDINLKDLRSHRNGEQLTVTAWIVNNSDQRVQIESCYVLKQKKQFNQDLGPRQSRELTLYHGPAPRNENEHQARIVYNLHANGDTFQNSYRIDYHLESDGTRTINGLHDDGPVRDV